LRELLIRAAKQHFGYHDLAPTQQVHDGRAHRNRLIRGVTRAQHHAFLADRPVERPDLLEGAGTLGRQAAQRSQERRHHSGCKHTQQRGANLCQQQMGETACHDHGNAFLERLHR